SLNLPSEHRQLLPGLVELLTISFLRPGKVHQKSMRSRQKLRLLVVVFCAGIFITPNLIYAQDGHADLPDSSSESSRAKHGNDVDREVSWRSLPKDFLHDQKNIWLFPTQWAKGRYL